MTESLPKVSVVIATLERPVLLHRAIRRVMEQTYAGEIEVVIVFDQSEPPPLEVEAPPGQWVAFCDDDYDWLPEKLSKQIVALQANPDCEIATSDIWVVYDDKTT